MWFGNCLLKNGLHVPQSLWSMASSLLHVAGLNIPGAEKTRGPFSSLKMVGMKVMGQEIQMSSSVVAVKYQGYCKWIVPQIHIVIVG